MGGGQALVDALASRAEASGVEFLYETCLLYTSDAADDLLCVDLGGRRIITQKITTPLTLSMPPTHPRQPIHT